MNLSYRARTTLIVASVSGVIFAGIFSALVVLLWQFEKTSLRQDLNSAFGQAVAEYQEAPSSPDFQEVVDSHPGVIIELTDLHGILLKRAGPHSEDSPLLSQQKTLGSFVLKGQASESAILRARSRLISVTALLWIPLTGFFALIVWITANAVFKPLNQMAEFASSIENDRLSERLPKIYGAEYDEFAEKLNGLLDRVQESFTRQERFAYDAAHELRTPLTIVSGLLQEELAATPKGAELSRVRRALEETERLAAISELLLASTHPAETGELAVCKLEACVQQTVSRWLDRFASKGIKIETEVDDLSARIGEREMETVIGNLLANAFIASPEHSTVRVKACSNLGRIVVKVSDEGKGVPPEMADSVFDSFVRLDSGRSRKDGGFGLGLAICKRLVSAYGGDIKVDGSVFTIQISPVSEPPLKVSN